MPARIQRIPGKPWGSNNREEQGVLNQIMFYCRSVPGYMIIRHKNVGAIFTDQRTGQARFGRDKFRDPGAPDLVVLRQGKHCVVETKKKTGEARREQEAWAERWRACGGVYYLCHTFEEFIEKVEKAA